MTHKTRLTKNLLVALIAMLFVGITTSFGQTERATSRADLAERGYLSGPEVSDDFDGNDDEYFYKFRAGPGKLSVTVEVTANQTAAGVTLDLYSGNKPILSNMLVQATNRGSDDDTRTVNLGKDQDLIIRIKGMRYGSSKSYPGVYKITLGGNAVNFEGAGPTGTGVQGNPRVPNESSDQSETSSPTSSSQGAAPVAPTAATQERKPNKVDRSIEKTRTKTDTVLRVLDIVSERKPN